MSAPDVIMALVGVIVGIATITYIRSMRRLDRDYREEMRVIRERRERDDEEMSRKWCAVFRSYGPERHRDLCERCRHGERGVA